MLRICTKDEAQRLIDEEHLAIFEMSRAERAKVRAQMGWRICRIGLHEAPQQRGLRRNAVELDLLARQVGLAQSIVPIQKP